MCLACKLAPAIFSLLTLLPDLLCCTQLNLSDNNIGVEGAKPLADALRVCPSVTSLNLSKNNLTNYGRDMTGITALADALKVNGSLTRLDVSVNYLGGNGVRLLRDAVREREGFVLVDDAND